MNHSLKLDTGDLFRVRALGVDPTRDDARLDYSRAPEVSQGRAIVIEMAKRYGMVEASEVAALREQARVDRNWIKAAQAGFAELNVDLFKLRNRLIDQTSARIDAEAASTWRTIRWLPLAFAAGWLASWVVGA